MATALFQVWHFILGFSLEATAVVLISKNVKDISFQPTLLTVLGTVLGFVISYRTSSSFERYNEGRRYWSTIILNARTMARTVWFHVPDVATTVGATEEEKRARTLVEKKTILNLTEAFAVAVKHYLRGEEGIRYEDLYHLTKFLPAYALPAGMPEPIRRAGTHQHHSEEGTSTATATNLPFPATSPGGRNAKFSVGPDGGPPLLPSRNPPRTSIFDIWPFTLLVRPLTKRGKKLGGKTAMRARAKLGLGRGEDHQVVSGNIPLEISLYISAYISALQQRKCCDVPTINLLINSLNAMVDSLTGLERILTTPIPFSFSVHLWSVTLLYCAFLPFQLYKSLNWLTIPGTALAAFIFTGFIVAGEEIEDPFGFDRNDLNLDHFTANIIRVELNSIASVPVPDPAVYAFRDDNDALFSNDANRQAMTPELWVAQGVQNIRAQLGRMTSHPTPPDEKVKNITKKKNAAENTPANEAPAWPSYCCWNGWRGWCGRRSCWRWSCEPLRVIGPENDVPKILLGHFYGAL
ncbi:SubName: Full=Uncharacterized protein {ECO:0000313/EMBL:CCA71351.1} [Serendipita indica DSM 11827]|nr:SubName: Full=Uncharacterized protein {ECO:0000313/EMBL:CCA71351.1} [Serendipita indica DSM 11827]